MNKYFPIKTKYLSPKRLRSPWLTPEVLSCINKKHDWYRKLKQKSISRSSYNEYCRALRELLNLAEREYYETKLNSLGNDCKKNWALLNKILKRA